MRASTMAPKVRCPRCLDLAYTLRKAMVSCRLQTRIWMIRSTGKSAPSLLFISCSSCLAISVLLSRHPIGSGLRLYVRIVSCC